MVESIEKIREIAAELHKPKQYNKDQPYSFHLQCVEEVAARYGRTSLEIVAACWGHDLLEDVPGLTAEKLIELGFPEYSVELIKNVTDGDGKNRREKKAVMFPRCRSNPDSVFIKLCDRISNVEQNIIEGGGPERNASLLRMYRREHEEFTKQLYRPGEFEDMWSYLDSLLGA